MTAIGLMYAEEKEQYGAYREAKGTVKIVENKMNADGITAIEACSQIGINYSDYTEAKMVMKAYSEKSTKQVPA